MVLGQLRSQTVAVVTHSRRRCTATQAPFSFRFAPLSFSPPRRLSLSVFRFYIEKFTVDEALTNVCTLSFTYGTTCIHKSVLVNNWLFVEFGMLVVVDENGEMFHLVFLFSPHLIVQLWFKSDLFPRNAVRATPRFCPRFTRTRS